MVEGSFWLGGNFFTYHGNAAAVLTKDDNGTHDSCDMKHLQIRVLQHIHY